MFALALHTGLSVQQEYQTLYLVSNKVLVEGQNAFSFNNLLVVGNFKDHTEGGSNVLVVDRAAFVEVIKLTFLIKKINYWQIHIEFFGGQMEVIVYKYYDQQFIMNQDDTDMKTPQKLDLSKSPQTQDKQSSLKKKEELKKKSIIKKLEFDDESIVIRLDGVLGRGKRNAPKEHKINSSYTLGLFNSIELNQDNMIVNKLIKPSDDDLFDQVRNDALVCRCRKSKCIKNYCVCSANNQECSFKCECYNCSNKQPKSATSKQSIQNSEYVGCNCRKQDCSKGYCECQKRKLKCTSKCKCSDDCKNCDFASLPFDLDI